MIQEQKKYEIYVKPKQHLNDSNVMQQILYRSNFPISHLYFLIRKRHLIRKTKSNVIFIAQAYVLSTTGALKDKKLYKTFMNTIPSRHSFSRNVNERSIKCNVRGPTTLISYIYRP